MPIVNAKEKTNDAVGLISKFQSGEITPIQTNHEWLDEVLLGGLLPSTILTVGGLSNHGKTHFLQKIENNILDSQKDVVLLRCNWESTVYKLLLRKIKERTGVKITDLLYNEPKGELLQQIKESCAQERRDGLYYLEEPSSPKEFYNEVSALLEAHKDKKVLVSIDHVGLVKGREKESIDGLFEQMNLLKKEHDFVCFIPLIQMHREKLLARSGNILQQAPMQTDFYGSDQLFQLSDAVVAVFMPSKIGIQEKYMCFTKNKYEYIDPKLIKSGGNKWNHFKPEGNIFYHAVKTRDVDGGMEDFKDVWVEQMFEVEEPLVDDSVPFDEDILNT